MNDFDADVARLEAVVRGFAQIMKRPHHWTLVVARSGVKLDRPSAMILQTVIANEPKQLGIQDLAKLLGIEPPSITRKTQQLEQAKYLRRVAHATDRRATCLRITPAGRRVAQKLWSAHLDIMQDALADWPDAKRHQFVDLFEQFTKDLAVVSDATSPVHKDRT